MSSMKQILFLVLLLLNPACSSANSDYVATDKIQLHFHGDTGELGDKNNILTDPAQVRLSIHMDFEQITQVEVRDVSADKPCRGEFLFPPPLSPSTLASFSLDPKANIKKIDFRIKLPCAVYSREFYIQVKVNY